MSPLLPILTNASADAATSTADTSRRITLGIKQYAFFQVATDGIKKSGGIMVLTETHSTVRARTGFLRYPPD